jgi:hypothetical protein
MINRPLLALERFFAVSSNKPEVAKYLVFNFFCLILIFLYLFIFCACLLSLVYCYQFLFPNKKKKKGLLFYVGHAK